MVLTGGSPLCGRAGLHWAIEVVNVQRAEDLRDRRNLGDRAAFPSIPRLFYTSMQMKPNSIGFI